MRKKIGKEMRAIEERTGKGIKSLAEEVQNLTQRINSLKTGMNQKLMLPWEMNIKTKSRDWKSKI